MITREKCLEWAKISPGCHDKQYVEYRLKEIVDLINRAYQEGQKDMQARAYHAVPFSHMKCADTIKALEIK